MATYHSTVYLSIHHGWWTLAIMNKATTNIFVQFFLCTYMLSFLLNTFVEMELLKVKVTSLSRVQLFATLRTVAHQAPLSMGFSRQEHWSRLPFPSPGHLSTQESNLLLLLSHFSRVRLCDPRDSSLSGSSVPGIEPESPANLHIYEQFLFHDKQRPKI